MNTLKSFFSLFTVSKKRKSRRNKTRRNKKSRVKRRVMKGGWGESLPAFKGGVMKGGWGGALPTNIQVA